MEVTEVQTYGVRKGRKWVQKARKGPKARVKPSVVRSLRNKTWELCKAIIKARYGNDCYTCDKKDLKGSARHTGHFIPRSVGGLILKYELRNLRPQCYTCNIDRGGNGAVFYRKLVEVEGQQYVDELFALKGQIIKENKDWYFALIAHYQQLLKEPCTPSSTT